jgi:hypothetical protein
MAQNEIYRPHQSGLILSLGRSAAGVEQSRGRNRRVGDIVPTGFQALTRTDIRCFAAILAPASVFALRGARNSVPFWTAMETASFLVKVVLPAQASASTAAPSTPNAIDFMSISFERPNPRRFLPSRDREGVTMGLLAHQR